MFSRFKSVALATTALAFVSGAAMAQEAADTATTPETEEMSDLRAFHESLLVLDSHLDTPALLVQPGFDITQRYSTDEDYSQVDLPRMKEGGLDGGFWVIYSPQGSLTTKAYQTIRDTALLRALSIHEMVAGHPDEFELALNSEDAARIHEDGKRIVYISIENSYPLGEDISMLDTFYKLGVRMVGPVHFRNNQFGDSATDIAGPQWDGLSPLGEELVKRANELGMIVDASHAHDMVFDDLMELSKTPIILSHSGSKAIYDHPRNIDDERLKQLAESGGLIQVNSYGGYVRELKNNPERSEALQALYAEMDSGGPKTAEAYQAMLAKRREVDEKYPPATATFEEFLEHLLHILEIAGPEHVGLGADWDGGGGVAGMEDVSDLPLITYRLLDEGYTEEDLANIWGLNLVRLLKAAEDYAASLKEAPPVEETETE